MAVLPYKEKESGKKEQVALMFNNIAKQYDFLNTFLSAGIDRIWRKKALNVFKGKKINELLDVATGTGSFALEANRQLTINKITGVDISKGMLDYGNKKINELKLEHKISFMLGDSENLPFEDNRFDAITVAFGVRNFENLSKGLTEMCRVLKHGSNLVVLEFSKPQIFPIKQLYFFYFKNILPVIGKIVSKDSSAYTYLPESVNAFPYGEEFKAIMLLSGFKKVEIKTLSFGIASIYIGTK